MTIVKNYLKCRKYTSMIIGAELVGEFVCYIEVYVIYPDTLYQGTACNVMGYGCMPETVIWGVCW